MRCDDLWLFTREAFRVKVACADAEARNSRESADLMGITDETHNWEQGQAEMDRVLHIKAVHAVAHLALQQPLQDSMLSLLWRLSCFQVFDREQISAERFR